LGNHINRTEKEGVDLFRYTSSASWQKKEAKKEGEDEEKNRDR